MVTRRRGDWSPRKRKRIIIQYDVVSNYGKAFKIRFPASRLLFFFFFSPCDFIPAHYLYYYYFFFSFSAPLDPRPSVFLLSPRQRCFRVKTTPRNYASTVIYFGVDVYTYTVSRYVFGYRLIGLFEFLTCGPTRRSRTKTPRGPQSRADH